MCALTNRERRTVRWGAIGVAVYLCLFFGVRGCNHLRIVRNEYRELVREAQETRRYVQQYQDKALLVDTLRQSLHLDPAGLAGKSLVADVSAAIQKAASGGGVKLGPIRETGARAAGHILASVQLEAVGPVPAVLKFVHHLETLGYPLLFDSLQLGRDSKKPGELSVNLTLVVLDAENWTEEGVRHG